MPAGLLEDLDLLGAGRRDLFRAVRLVAEGRRWPPSEVHVFLPFEMEAGTEGILAKSGQLQLLRYPKQQRFEGKRHLLAEDAHRVGERRRAGCRMGATLGVTEGCDPANSQRSR